MSLRATTWQTVGPFFSLGLDSLFANDIAGEGILGKRVAITGRLLDSLGLPIPDAVLEIWQANSHGKYPHPDDTQDKPLEPGFRGFARIPTGNNGQFSLTTIKPGSVPGPDGVAQSPHLVVSILMRGLLRGLVTRAYFPEEAALTSDPILQLVEPARRNTLILQRSLGHDNVFAWDIHMQGEHETVFFDF